MLADGSHLFPDAIVAATGCHPGLEPLVGHLTAIREHGIPSLDNDGDAGRVVVLSERLTRLRIPRWATKEVFYFPGLRIPMYPPTAIR